MPGLGPAEVMGWLVMARWYLGWDRGNGWDRWDMLHVLRIPCPRPGWLKLTERTTSAHFRLCRSPVALACISSE